MSRSNSSRLFSPKSARGSKQAQTKLELVDNTIPVKLKRLSGNVEAKNEKQAEYIKSILTNTVTFGVGAAGTGKTFLCSAIAAQELEAGRISKIILTRPSVEAEPSLGHLPGTLDEKYLAFILPYMDAFHEVLGKTKTEYLIKRKIIEAIPLGFLRGRSLANSMVLFDESQNATVSGMRLVLTRLGIGTTAVITGDLAQSDLRGPNGLSDAMTRLRGVNSLKFVEFSREDVVRSGIVQRIIERYED